MQMKNKELYTIRTSYSYYKNKVDNPLSMKEYTEIMYDFFQFILEELYAAREVFIPKLGSLQILGKKKKAKIVNNKIEGLSPDWKRTKQLWNTCEECKNKKQLVYHLNEHTDSIRYKFFWKKKNVLVENKLLYYFKPCRFTKRKLASLIKQGQEFYLA